MLILNLGNSLGFFAVLYSIHTYVEIVLISIKINKIINYFILSNRKDFRHIALRNMSTKRALVLLATGTEEMEFVIAADVLVRGGVSL